MGSHVQYNTKLGTDVQYITLMGSQFQYRFNSEGMVQCLSSGVCLQSWNRDCEGKDATRAVTAPCIPPSILTREYTGTVLCRKIFVSFERYTEGTNKFVPVKCLLPKVQQT